MDRIFRRVNRLASWSAIVGVTVMAVALLMPLLLGVK